MKFEEKVEEGGERWSKPHVSTLTLHSLFELRTCLQTGSILLDLEGYSLPQIVGESCLGQMLHPHPVCEMPVNIGGRRSDTITAQVIFWSNCYIYLTLPKYFSCFPKMFKNDLGNDAMRLQIYIY